MFARSSPTGTGVVILINTCLAAGAGVVGEGWGAGAAGVVVLEQAVIAGIDTNIMSERTIANNTDNFIMCV
jgi:hypothetical protein